MNCVNNESSTLIVVLSLLTRVLCMCIVAYIHLVHNRNVRMTHVCMYLGVLTRIQALPSTP